MEEIDALKLQITDLEQQLNVLRRHNDDLDTKINSNQAKMATLDNDLRTATKEIEKLNELNIRLQKEKKDAVK